MLDSKTVLIVDDNAYGALDLSSAVEERDGRVAGPAGTVQEALAILESEEVAAAVVDCEVNDASALVMLLAERDVPFVIQCSNGLPNSLDGLNGRLSVMSKPVDSGRVVDRLLIEIAKADQLQPAD